MSEINDLRWGEPCHYKAKNAYFTGYIVGAFKKRDGSEFLVGETESGGTFYGPKRQFGLGHEIPLEEGKVIIRDRSKEPAQRVLPPLSTGGKY